MEKGNRRGRVKFRTVFIVFNIFLLIFLAVLCVTPVLLLTPDFASVFWRANWFLILILAGILIAFDTYFFINRRLYALLEKEDWPALVHYLEEKVIHEGKYSSHLVRLLANTYLVLSDSPSVMSLENKAAIARPSLVNDNVLVFGTARILGRDISGAVRFFETRLANSKSSLRPWIHWYYGFALLLDKQFEAAADRFILLARESSNGVVTGLSAYFLQDNAIKTLVNRNAEFGEAAMEGAGRVRKAYPQMKDWIRETRKLSTEIHAAALTKYLEETGRWLYSNTEGKK